MTVAAYSPLEHLVFHRPPMILIDRLVEANEQEVVGGKRALIIFIPKTVQSYVEEVGHDHSRTH